MPFAWRAPPPRYKVADEALGRVFVGSSPSEPLRARNAFLGGAAVPEASWPKNLLDPSYARMVLDAVRSHEHDLTWTNVQAGRVGFFINARPLRIGGVFVNVSATLQQELADLLGAMLPTPKMMDAAWLMRAATIDVVTLPIASTSAAMLRASQKLDAEILAAGDPAGCMLCQKTWALGNSLLAHRGRAMNYGDFVIPTSGTSWRGIATEACVSIRDPAQGRVIQGQGWAHDPSHLDYSQVGWFVLRECTVDGARADMHDVLQDKTLAPFVSHEGVITVPGLRQPGLAPHAPTTAAGAPFAAGAAPGPAAASQAPQFAVFDPPSTREQATVQGLMSLVMLDHNTLRREGDSHETAVEIDRKDVLEGLEQLTMTASGALRATVQRLDLIGQASRDASKVSVAALDAYTHAAGPLAKSIAQEMMRGSANAAGLAVAIGALPGTTPITGPARAPPPTGKPPAATPQAPSRPGHVVVDQGGELDETDERQPERKRAGAGPLVAALALGTCLLMAKRGGR
jgi:hypothetical protein